MSTDRLELRYPDDDGVEALAAVAAGGIHDPDAPLPFKEPWSRGSPDEVADRVRAYLWRTRASTAPEAWDLPFLVSDGAEVVGVQALHTRDFAVTRVLRTGSWLGRLFQGRGIGREMRAAVLTFAFEHLGALDATSGAWRDNATSLSVSRRLGYLDDGIEVASREGTRTTMQRLRLTRDRWSEVSTSWPEVTVDGFGRCRPHLGLD